MSVAGLDRMTTGSAVWALSYRATQVDIEYLSGLIFCHVIPCSTVDTASVVTIGLMPKHQPSHSVLSKLITSSKSTHPLLSYGNVLSPVKLETVPLSENAMIM